MKLLYDGKTKNVMLDEETGIVHLLFKDSATGEKLDKDRFRRDLGGVEEAYQTIMGRLEQYMVQAQQ